MIIYCVKMRKVESINFRFGGRSTTFCSSAVAITHSFQSCTGVSVMAERGAVCNFPPGPQGLGASYLKDCYHFD